MNNIIEDIYDLKRYIITIPDFPKKGIMFRDITGILNDPKGFELCNSLIEDRSTKFTFDSVAGLESRGFIFGAVLAKCSSRKFIPVRKAGKLPREVVSESYDLEYGKATIEIHKDAIKPGDKILLVDDLIATGGTLNAAANIVEKLGGEVAGILCIIDLPDLGGRKLLENRGYKVETLCSFEGD